MISIYAKGLTTGEIASHLEEIYGTSISKDTISRITDAIVADMEAWQTRPVEPIYAVVLIDAIVVKVSDTQVANRPVSVAIGVNMDGAREVLGCSMIHGGYVSVTEPRTLWGSPRNWESVHGRSPKPVLWYNSSGKNGGTGVDLSPTLARGGNRNRRAAARPCVVAGSIRRMPALGLIDLCEPTERDHDVETVTITEHARHRHGADELAL